MLLENIKYFMDGYEAMPACPNINSFHFPKDNPFINSSNERAINFKCKFKRSIDTLDLLKVNEINNGTISEASWGETSGLYPSSYNKFNPEKWDIEKTNELLKARAAIDYISKNRNSHLRKSFPRVNDVLEKRLALFHLTENFPEVDIEIKNNSKVKWFYLGSTRNAIHTGLNSTQKIVKVYGPFYNVGGGDVKVGDTYLIFYEAK